MKRLSTPKISPNISRTKMQNLDSVFDAVLSSPTGVPSRLSPVGLSVKPENAVNLKSASPVLTAPSPVEASQTTDLPLLPPTLPAELVSKIGELIKVCS